MSDGKIIQINGRPYDLANDDADGEEKVEGYPLSDVAAVHVIHLASGLTIIGKIRREPEFENLCPECGYSEDINYQVEHPVQVFQRESADGDTFNNLLSTFMLGVETVEISEMGAVAIASPSFDLCKMYLAALPSFFNVGTDREVRRV